MVKSLTSILVALTLLGAAATFESLYVNERFDRFSDELQTLAAKVEEERANGEDGKAIRASWEEKKSRLHVWIPHNDVARVDDVLSEAIQLIATKNYPLASAKLEILINLCKTVPGTYRADIENIL